MNFWVSQQGTSNRLSSSNVAITVMTPTKGTSDGLFFAFESRHFHWQRVARTSRSCYYFRWRFGRQLDGPSTSHKQRVNAFPVASGTV